MFFEPHYVSKDPLATRFPTNLRTEFVYGDHDWMDPHFANYLKNHRCGEEFVTIKKVPDAGHQFYLEHPSFLADLLLEFLNEENSKVSNLTVRNNEEDLSGAHLLNYTKQEDSQNRNKNKNGEERGVWEKLMRIDFGNY